MEIFCKNEYNSKKKNLFYDFYGMKNVVINDKTKLIKFALKICNITIGKHQKPNYEFKTDHLCLNLLNLKLTYVSRLQFQKKISPNQRKV